MTCAVSTRDSSLERHFRTIETIILSRQDPVTGLLPASTAITAHGDYTDAWVRDNVYSILSVWGLALAYRNYDPHHHRTYLLSQSVVKLMRGLLVAMMHQCDRIEAFKITQNPINALHAKYGTHTGLAVVGDDEWGHLQLDATSLYVLMMGQMIASGLHLIYTMDEVDFVQNLVHYISRTYCTPDFGIWERGNKINHGTTEINCSSVGMAKAALEAMDGFNLFGNATTQEAVIHVVASDVARSRFTLHSLLPRESNSKETDAALLSIIGYPAYAIEDENLVKQTRDKIIKKLCGRYGCKRFLLDGHQSSIEDSTRLHYEPSELRDFENIESEWPLFFTYLLLDALMRNDSEAIKEWYERLEPLFIEQEGQKLLPELYIVPKELIAAEKANLGSQRRIPNENLPLVWAQSLYILSEMILDGLLAPSDIDPLCRRERVGFKRTTYPLVTVLAENELVKQQLRTLGFNSETLEEIKPIQILHASHLSEIHTLLGKNGKLGLSGRPFAVARTISTSHLFRIEEEEVLFLPYYFNPKGFYFGYDNQLLCEHFRSSLTFLAKHWDQEGEPLVPFLVREDMIRENQMGIVLELLDEINKGKCDATVIITGSLNQLLKRANVERMDFLEGFKLEDLEPQPLQSEYESAALSHDWSTLRRIADETGNYDDRIEDALLELIIRQKRLAVGRAYSEKATFSKPHDAAFIVQTIGEFCGNNVAERVLTQEIILHLGDLIRTEPELFINMLTVRTWYFVQLLVGQISREYNFSIGDGYDHLLSLAPHAVYRRLRTILNSFALEVTQLIDQENLHTSGTVNVDTLSKVTLTSEEFDVDDWGHWRKHMGMIGHLSSKFYKNIWHLLQQCTGLVIGDKYSTQSRIGSELTLESTAGEHSFALRIDALLHTINAPDYRQLNIEAIESVARILRQNPQLHIDNDLILDVWIGYSVRMAWEWDHVSENYDEQRGCAWETFYTLSPRETDKAFVEAFIYLLTPEETNKNLV